MPFEIKTSKTEFSYAESNGYVDGEIPRGSNTVYVHIRLGREGKYRPRRSDKDALSYRYFQNCTIKFAETAKDRDEGYFIPSLTTSWQEVIIYC